MKRKEKIKEVFSDVVLELVLYLLFFGIGAFILYLFGFRIDGENTDFDLVFLLGLGVCIVIVVSGFVLVRLIKKIKNKKDS
jgi:membrane protein DedA with SNARE-associated domain